MQGARIVGASGSSPLRRSRSDEVAAQRRRWTFYEIINV
jgi:hypothetical protein